MVEEKNTNHLEVDGFAVVKEEKKTNGAAAAADSRDTIVRTDYRILFQDYSGHGIYTNVCGSIFSDMVTAHMLKIVSGRWMRQMGLGIQFKTAASTESSSTSPMNFVRLYMDGEHSGCSAQIAHFKFEREAKIAAEELQKHVQKLMREKHVTAESARPESE